MVSNPKSIIHDLSKRLSKTFKPYEKENVLEHITKPVPVESIALVTRVGFALVT